MRLLCALFAIIPLFAQYTAPSPIFSKLFGGSSGSESATAIAVDPSGNAAVIGQTGSPDFPVTANAYQSSFSVEPLASVAASGVTYPPIGGAIDVIALAVSSDLSTVYAASDSGLFRSTDGGKTWSQATPGLAGATSLAVDSENPKLLYASIPPSAVVTPTQEPTGIYSSADGGNTWTRVSPSARAPLSPISAPTGVLYSFDRQILRSTDGGATWSANLAPHSYNIFAAVLAPSNPSVVYTVPSDGLLYFSTDGGATWTPTGAMFTAYPANGTLYIAALAVSPMDENTLWAVTESGALFQSTNGGATFSSLGQVNLYAVNLSVYGQNIAVLGQGASSVSLNGGSSWQTEPGSGAALALPSSILIGAFTAPEAFLTKWSADGTSMLFSTFLSGSAGPLAEDSSGNTWVVNTGPSQSVSLLKFDPSGNLLASPSLNGFTPAAIALDSSGNVYLAGQNPSNLAAVTKFSPQAALIYSQPLPQISGSVILSGIAVDASGSIYVAGNTGALSLPVTSTALQPEGPFDFTSTVSGGAGFLAIVPPSGANLTYLSYLGGADSTAKAVALDADGNVYVTGVSTDDLFPLAVTKASRACTQTQDGGSFAFAIKFNPSSSTPAWVDELGGQCLDTSRGTHIALDSAGDVWIGGYTNSGVFPTLAPIELTGYHLSFLSELNPAGTQLLFSSYAPGFFSLGPNQTLYLAGSALPNPPKTNSSLTIPATSALIESFTLDGTQPAVIDSIPTAGLTQLGTIAPGELLQINGRGLGPSTAAGAQIDSNGRVANSLAGTQVLFNGVPAPLISVAESEIQCVVPFETTSPTANIQIVRNSTTMPGVLIGVTPVSATPAVLAVANPDGTLNSQSNPAHLGQTVILYVTGLGDTTPSVPDGAVYQPPLPAPLYPIGQVGASPAYAGPAPGLVAGIWQINFALPSQLDISQSPFQLGLISSYVFDSAYVMVDASIWTAP